MLALTGMCHVAGAIRREVESEIDCLGLPEALQGLFSFWSRSIDGPIALAGFKEFFFLQQIQMRLHSVEIQIHLVDDPRFACVVSLT